MSLRSFALPSRTRPATVPRVGGPVPPFWTMADAGRPVVVCFLRHVGCPFAEATLREARRLADGDAAVTWLGVSHAPRDDTERWCEQLGGSGAVRIVIDEPRAVYAAWGLSRTSLGHFAGRRSLSGVARLARQGIRNRRASGTRWQQAGTFAVDRDRILRWRHVPDHAGELPDLTAARAALASPPGTGPASAPRS